MTRLRKPFLVASALSSCLAALAFAPCEGTQASEGPTYADYAVAADHPEASAAGASILAQGGNAADAAAATMLALGVAGPASSGLGGGGFALYYRASDQSLTFLDFRETAPAAATSDMFAARPGDSEEVAENRSRRGGLAVGVLGEPRGIEELVKRFGTLPLKTLVKPAESLARDGFSINSAVQRAVGWLSGKVPFATQIYGEKPVVGAKAKNPELAKTLRSFGAEGANLFYRGRVAREILKAQKAQGGVLTAKDLADYKVAVREPLRGTAFGYDWATAPLPSAGGYTLMDSLGLVSRWLPTDADWKPASRMHALVESWKGAYLDRQGYFGDPDQVEVPMAALTAPERVAQRAARFHPALALPPSSYALPLPAAPAAAKQPDNRGTSHLCVVDKEGNVAAITTTVNLGFGSTVPVAGFWLNDEMDDFAREVGRDNAFGLIGGAPNLPAPNKRPLSSMTPTIVFQGGKPVLCVGGSGGSRIPTAVEQVALYVLHDGMHPLAAIEAPRVHHQADPLQVDAKNVPKDVEESLTRRGHHVQVSPWSAHVQAIRILPDGKLQAGSDPHKGGAPAGK